MQLRRKHTSAASAKIAKKREHLLLGALQSFFQSAPTMQEMMEKPCDIAKLQIWGVDAADGGMDYHVMFGKTCFFRPFKRFSEAMYYFMGVRACML